MKLLRKGSKGPLVVDWQEFLVGRGAKIIADGDFGNKTVAATKKYQRGQDLYADGIVGNATLATAMAFDSFAAVEIPDEDWPPKPTNVKPYFGNAARARKFGRFDYIAAPTSRNREAIKITGDWKRKHIERVRVDGIPGSKGVWLHKAAAGSFVDMWEEWAAAGLRNDILTWNGSYVPRFIRGSTKTLSNHAWGTAFDINAQYNRIKQVPAQLGEAGCVRHLVEIANAHGWYWGGHFSRQDGMHFELGKKVV